MIRLSLAIGTPPYDSLWKQAFLMALITFVPIASVNAQTLISPKPSSPLDQDKDQLEAIEQWIGSPVGMQRAPWFVCVRIQGSSLMYKAKVYSIQARYQSWTAEWHRFRPHPYPSDHGVGLVTTKELATLYAQIQSLATQGQVQYELTTQTPPCGAELYETAQINGLPLQAQMSSSTKSAIKKRARHLKYRHRKRKSRKRSIEQTNELLVDIWLLNKDKANTRSWQHWHLLDPHLKLDQHPQLMMKKVIELVNNVAPEGADTDRLIQAQETGILLLNVTAASKVWLNGVYHGLWPSSQPIYLAPDDYQVHVVPLDSNISPITFEGLEISAGVKTKFKVEVD